MNHKGLHQRIFVSEIYFARPPWIVFFRNSDYCVVTGSDILSEPFRSGQSGPRTPLPGIHRAEGAGQPSSSVRVRAGQVSPWGQRGVSVSAL